MSTTKIVLLAVLLSVGLGFNLPGTDAKTSAHEKTNHTKSKTGKHRAEKEEAPEPVDAIVPYTSAQQFQKDVLQASTPVLVDFSATWCAPCRAMAPFVHELAVKYSGKLKVYKIDIDDDEDLADDLKVEAVPTFMVFSGGKILKSETGNIGASKLESEVSQVLGQGGSVRTAEKEDASAF